MTVMLVDGHNLLVRSIKAMEYRPDRAVLTTASGIPTGSLMVFINTLSTHVRAEQPTHLLVFFDGGKSPRRVALDPAYKANRVAGNYGEETGPESPFTLAKEFLTLSNVRWYLRRDVEADDLIAYQVHRRTQPTVVLSNDKDFFQLVDHDVTQIRIGTSDTPTQRITPEWIEAKYGCQPRHLGKVLALTGDTGDNVQGVVGIGPKTAVKLLAKHNYDLQAVLDEPRVSPHRDRVITNQALVDLDQVYLPPLVVPPPPAFEPTTNGSLMYLPLLDWLGRYELRAIKERLVTGLLWGTKVPNTPARS
jgi:DNA polymerase I